jgi:hypothetical protein
MSDEAAAELDFRVAELVRRNQELIIKSLHGRAEWCKGGRKATQRELDNPPTRYERSPEEEDRLRERMAEFGEKQRAAERLADELREMFKD